MRLISNKLVLPFGTNIAGENTWRYTPIGTALAGNPPGFFLNGEGDAVNLYNASAGLLDSVQFGFQTAGLSIGRMGRTANGSGVSPLLARRT